MSNQIAIENLQRDLTHAKTQLETVKEKTAEDIRRGRAAQTRLDAHKRTVTELEHAIEVLREDNRKRETVVAA